MADLFKRQIVGTALRPFRLARNELRGASASVLRRWNEAGVALTLWDRAWDPALNCRIDALGFRDLPRARFMSRPETAEVDVAAAFADVHCPDEVVMAALTVDIESLICRYADATGATEVDVRLEAIQDDACRLFHADRVRARLVTTYRGPGTEWVTPEDASAALRSPETFSGAIQQMPRYAVGLFPGSLAPKGALVHRSPRNSTTGELRLFLCINEKSRTFKTH
jgi:hypothetical protein